ncbi:hypothetical protein [Flexithrix dorotheae]|uniref:hypothetical protein n=1 Tax=Flexithrix dorotheae TaxID=70993 RepID=UPI00036158C4|nr:hypothetical protein [Flexithrix dorotheae]
MKLYFLPLLFLVASLSNTYAQDAELYSTSGLEIIFSGAAVHEKSGQQGSNILRFAPVFNFQSMLNYDANPNLGIFSGIAIRNVGFIYDPPNSGERKKYRTYNLGVPFGVKIGQLRQGFFYGGYELELPFHYKEKTIVNEQKSKFSVWFSNRTPTLTHSFFAGIQLPKGFNLKFKYYLTNFFNHGYTETDSDGNTSQPYAGFDANVFYISLNANLFKNVKFYYSKEVQDYYNE